MMDDTIFALAKLRAVRATHVGDLSRDDLLAITKAGRELVAHAEAELERRVRFPSRLAPDLVLRFLDVPSIGASLAVSAGWGKTAEGVFQSVAADLGVASIGEGKQWRDIVREQVSRRWVAARMVTNGLGEDIDDDFQSEEFEGLRLGMTSVRGVDSEDTYVTGRGYPLRQGCERRWRVKLDKDPSTIDAVGWCISSSFSSMTPLLACLWNSNGQEYDFTYDWIHEPVFVEGNNFLIGVDRFRNHTLEVHVRFVNDSAHTLRTELRILSEHVARAVRLQYTLCGQDWADLARSDLVIAPMVRIYESSVATLV